MLSIELDWYFLFSWLHSSDFARTSNRHKVWNDARYAHWPVCHCVSRGDTCTILPEIRPAPSALALPRCCFALAAPDSVSFVLYLFNGILISITNKQISRVLCISLLGFFAVIYISQTLEIIYISLLWTCLDNQSNQWRVSLCACRALMRGSTSHKNVDPNTFWVLKLYYTSRVCSPCPGELTRSYRALASDSLIALAETWDMDTSSSLSSSHSSSRVETALLCTHARCAGERERLSLLLTLLRLIMRLILISRSSLFHTSAQTALAEIPVLHVRRERAVLRDALRVPLHRRPERYSLLHSRCANRNANPNPNPSSLLLASPRLVSLLPASRSLWRSPLHCARFHSSIRVAIRSLVSLSSSPVSPHHRSHPAPAPVAWEHSALPLLLPLPMPIDGRPPASQSRWRRRIHLPHSSAHHFGVNSILLLAWGFAPHADAILFFQDTRCTWSTADIVPSIVDVL